MSQIYYENWWWDEQYTPQRWVEILLPHIQHLKNKVIWLPFDTEDSHFVKVLRKEWFNIVNSHISEWKDFITYEPEYFDCIISNPPYKNKRIYWERALSFSKPFALLLPVNILSDSMIWNTLMKDWRWLQLLIPDKRIRFYNAVTGVIWNQPTFKACYFRVWIFREDIIFTKY